MRTDSRDEAQDLKLSFAQSEEKWAPSRAEWNPLLALVVAGFLLVLFGYDEATSGTCTRSAPCTPPNYDFGLGMVFVGVCCMSAWAFIEVRKRLKT